MQTKLHVMQLSLGVCFMAGQSTSFTFHSLSVVNSRVVVLFIYLFLVFLSDIVQTGPCSSEVSLYTFIFCFILAVRMIAKIYFFSWKDCKIGAAPPSSPSSPYLSYLILPIATTTC